MDMVTFIRQKKEILLAALAIIILYMVLSLVGIGCPIKFVTGISCAGCGMTRAWMSLLRLDIKQAFNYHPLFPLPAMFLIWFLIKKKLSKKLYKTGIIFFIIIFMIVYLVRMFDPTDSIVVFEPGNNIFYKINHWV